MRRPLILIASLVSTSLAGCAGTKDSVLPQDGPSMKTIYERHIEEMGARDPMALREALGHRLIADAEEPLAGYTWDARNEIDAIFPRLPNPTLVMYVFPHLAGDEPVPVPGYATAFPMYERIEYALPGEVPGGW